MGSHHAEDVLAADAVPRREVGGVEPFFQHFDALVLGMEDQHPDQPQLP